MRNPFFRSAFGISKDDMVKEVIVYGNALCEDIDVFVDASVEPLSAGCGGTAGCVFEDGYLTHYMLQVSSMSYKLAGYNRNDLHAAFFKMFVSMGH